MNNPCDDCRLKDWHIDCSKCIDMNEYKMYQKGRAETIDQLEQKLKIWDNKANAIPDYVWHCLNVMKEQNND